MGGTSAIAIASGAVQKITQDMRGDQVVLVVAPPHLIDKWKRELISIYPNSIVERLDRHEERSNSTESKGFAGILPYRTKYVYMNT